MTDSISNGESGSSVRGKLNAVIEKANQFEFTNSNRNINVRPLVNYIDPTVSISVISGGGDTGGSTRLFEGDGATTRNEIGANASYTPGTANVATISGGYDNRNDQLAGTICGGGHNLLSYLGNHGTVGGGSHNYVLNASDYAVIAGGTNNVVGEVAGAGQAVISGGQNNEIQQGTNNVIAGGSTNVISGGGSPSVISGGFGNTISSSVGINAILSGYQNSITGSAQWSVVCGGQDNTTASVGSFIGAGRNNTIASGGTYSAVFGQRNTVTSDASYALVNGVYITAYIAGSQNFTAQSFSDVSGSCQAISFTMGRQTTNDTATDLAVVGTGTYPVPANNSAWCGRINVVGRERGTTNVAMWSWDFGIAKATGNIVIKYGGTAPTASVDNITVAAVPIILSGTSTFRIRVQGKAATSIDWAARIDLIQTLQ